MLEKRQIDQSEPDLLIGIGDRLPSWVALVGLVGSGQSIYSGEEAGLGQWRHAVEAASNPDGWEICCPAPIADTFIGLDVRVETDLELRVPIRARRAVQLDTWVSALLAAELSDAEALASQIVQSDFSLYATRDLEAARCYAVDRYRGEFDARYGLIATSHARNLLHYEVDNEWMATSRMNIAKWFNAPPGDPRSCCALTQPATEFGCQGLELDLPIVCWGTDMCWVGNGWQLRPRRRRYPQDDPDELLRNAYRVLLTRGRDGLVVWVPPEPALEETFEALVLAGCRPAF